MRAGISIPDSFIPYSEDSSYTLALISGLLNTILMSVFCIFTSSILGLTIAFSRLSQNWLLQKLCMIYVEIFRNLPPLLIILFLYFGILQEILPPVQKSLSLPFHIYINQRGIYCPALHFQKIWLWSSSIICLSGFFIIRRIKNPFNQYILLLHLMISLAFIVWLFYHDTFLELPKLETFNITGGRNISLEFLALFLSLSLYTSALISETIRTGIEGVNNSLKETGLSLGLAPGLVMRLITMPLALRIIIPPLTSQYVNLIKNTSLGIAIGYSELMRISNTVLNQTNQSLAVVIIWMGSYLSLSLIVSTVMNWLNKTTLRGHGH
jgi:general L-amino acid transport system permease protein